MKISGSRVIAGGLMDDSIFEKTVYQPFEQRFVDQRILSTAWSDHDT